MPFTPLFPRRKRVGKSSENLGKTMDFFGAFSANSWGNYTKGTIFLVYFFVNNGRFFGHCPHYFCQNIVDSEKYRIFAVSYL